MINIISYCYTVGHSNHSTAELLNLLNKHKIEVIADVRRFPYSKYVKQYNQDNFKTNVENEGLEYLFLGDVMGGKVGKGYEKIKEKLKKDKVITLLCAEKDPSRCHRSFLLSPFLIQ